MSRVRRRFRSIPIEAEDDPYAVDPRDDYEPEYGNPLMTAPRCACGAALARLDGWMLTTCWDCLDKANQPDTFTAVLSPRDGEVARPPIPAGTSAAAPAARQTSPAAPRDRRLPSKRAA